jgi:hypothetical protein
VLLGNEGDMLKDISMHSKSDLGNYQVVGMKTGAILYLSLPEIAGSS